jgi:hypothetical protein
MDGQIWLLIAATVLSGVALPVLTWIVKKLWEVTLNQKLIGEHLKKQDEVLEELKTKGSDRLDAIVTKAWARGILAGVLTVILDRIWKMVQNRHVG